MEAPHVIAKAVADDDFPAMNYSSALYSTATGFLENVSYMFSDAEVKFDSCDHENPYFNCSLDDFLGYVLGPQRLPLTVAVPITVLYVLIFVTGVVGNVSVCVVIVRNTSMHTATNYYLFSLAVSDLMLLLLGLPNDISVYWHQYPYSLGIVFCKMRAVLSEASSYVSVLTIVAFSTERYLAICHPLHLYTMSGLQRAVRIIAALWLVSLLCAVPFGIETKIHYLDYPPNSNNKSFESAFCAMLNPPYGWPVWELSSIVFFMLPAGVILVLYCRMGFRIRARSRHHLGKGVKGSVHGETRQVQSRKAIIRMLAAVVIAFFVCWAPFHAQRLIYLYGQEWTHFKSINEWMFSIAGWLYYVSSTVNPILYNVMSNRYRVAFRETLCCKRRNSNNHGFSREQSSFRETTIATSGEGTHLVRVRSVSVEPIHRTNTTTANRLSRNSTMSSTISKEYSNSNPKTTRWGDKQWNLDNSNYITKNKQDKSSLKGKFYNMNGDAEDYHLPNQGGKRSITFEKETNNLLNDDQEMIKYESDKNANRRISDSRSDSHIMASGKKTCFSNELVSISPEHTLNLNKNPQDSIDSKQVVVVLLEKCPTSGLKKFYPTNLSKNPPFSNVLQDSADERAMLNSEETETCI